MNSTILENYAKIKDPEKLVDILLDEQLHFFKVFEQEIGGNSRDKIIAILKIFKVIFAKIIEVYDEKSIQILTRVFHAKYFKSDVRQYFSFLEENVKNIVKSVHIDALQGYFFYLQNLDKVLYNDCEVRLFLEDEFKVFDLIVNTIKRNTEDEFEIEHPKERLCQKPISGGDFDPYCDKYQYKYYYRNLPIFPTTEDVHRGETPRLPENIIYGSYENVDHYLHTQFMLLREILVRPLHESVQKLILMVNSERKADENKPLKECLTRLEYDQSVLVYHDVSFEGAMMSNSGIIFTIKFDASPLKNIDWVDSARLLPGSILCLSSDLFKTLFFVIVVNRDEKKVKEGEIDVFLVLRSEYDDNEEHSKEEDFFIDFFTLVDGKKYLAVESVTYFEAYRHSLQCLKDFNWKMNFPFKDYIVDVSMNIKSPKYLKNGARYDLSCSAHALHRNNKDPEENMIKRIMRASQLKDIDITRNCTEIPWDLMDFDQSQFEAFHAALTREFVVIQGPPGCGKTYTALRIVQALLANRLHWCGTDDPEYSCPILILSYKNHALDQFLEGITKFVSDFVHQNPTDTRNYRSRNDLQNEALQKIIRVGGNCKSSFIKRLTLFERRKGFDFSKIPKKERQEYFKSRKTVEESFVRMTNLGIKYKRIRMGYKIAGREIYRYIKELGPQALSQLGININYSVNDEDDNPEDEISEAIMKWLGLDEVVNIKHYKKVSLELIRQEIHKNDKTEQKNEIKETDDATESQMTEEEEDIDEADESETPATRQWMKDRQIDPDEYKVDREIGVLGSELFVQEITDEMVAKCKDEEKRKVLEAALLVKRNVQNDDLMSETELEKLKNLKSLEPKNRWRLYRYWIDKFFDHVKKEFRLLNEKIAVSQKELARSRQTRDFLICREAWIVGMTVTGAAKYRKLVELLKPKIVIVEEAAEILEAHIVSILTENTQHLILIGDHQQLRPIPGIQELATIHNMEISLFERMVKNEMTYYQLQNQHRMRPIISSLLRKNIYNVLNDHESVKKFKNLPFTCGTNLFFLNHNKLEDKRSFRHGCSCANSHEVEFVVELARYFVSCGIDASQITILTTYNAQLELIKKKILSEYWDMFVKRLDMDQKKNGEKPKSEFKMRISTVDGFQGEENDIILISFVRSNIRDDIGFLKISNRVCVALSRARKGMFCIGNFEKMRSISELWQNILAVVKDQNAIGDKIKLGCKCKSKEFDDPKRLKMYNATLRKCSKCFTGI
ncbi:NFX1-type zinc finger-containing protein 1-like protein [Dinothrombium tinctorium]|uniref:NFX1-type zinc finger-containing protein 1-like protein n=1 Tax=Dinothrombium tinctorium TaxID=1965070 RepID=A0A3S3P5W8_9ACAR|nr:NFX1-type zinc finger-containing protein 1-like protein [Dinothrombium tinctorium]RWS10046.1 NFX1-type zinc finger-containing protein 1-like protein [Dinothrombium tinctorium]RWS10074.1 NFX1-type zinc finger-containing protein 1-like protein [Dinothrombium tinctorium]